MTITKNKYILEKNEEIELKSLIESGKSVGEIKKLNSFDLKSEKAIKRFANQWNLGKALSLSNKNYKGALLRSSWKNKIEQSIKSIEKYDKVLQNMIFDSGATTYDLIKFFNKNNVPIAYRRLKHYLIKNSLYEKCAQNGEEKISNQARINGAKSALTLAGVEKKPITDEITNRFLELKNSKMYKTKVYEVIKREFGYKYRKIKQLCELYGYPEHNPQTGKLNSMYGKPPSPRAGIGVKCWIVDNGKKIFCRSSLELKVYLFLLDENTKFQLSRHRIKYKDKKGTDRTYNPDFVIDDCIYEIKPKSLTTSVENTLKFQALKNYCEKFHLNCSFVTEETFDIKKYDNILYIDNLIKIGRLIIDEKNLSKLKKYIKS